MGDANLPDAADLKNQNNMSLGFAKLKRMSKEFSFKVGIVVWPTFGDDHICNCFYERTKKGDLYFDELIAEHQFPSMHLLELFQRDLLERCPAGSPNPCPSPVRLYTAADGIHPNSLGASIAAKQIRPLIEKLLQEGN